MRRLVCVIGALVVTAGGAGASTVSTGLRGSVAFFMGGACLQDDGCGKRPVANEMLVFSAAGRPTKRTMTHDDGTYRVLLAPGTYHVKATASGFQGRVAPSVMSVQQGRMKTVDFVLVTPRIP